LTCDEKDLWYLKCDKVLTMGCTEDDLSTSAQSLEGDDGTPDVSSVVSQEESSQEAATLSSGAFGLATGVTSLVLSLVVAMAE
jgi:hypothetical protein